MSKNAHLLYSEITDKQYKKHCCAEYHCIIVGNNENPYQANSENKILKPVEVNSFGALKTGPLWSACAASVK